LISADYCLAPEHPHSAAVEDRFDTLKLVAKEGPGKFDTDPNCAMMIVGISAFIHSLRLLLLFE
jgi:acetyl esterase/lipase